MSVTLVSCIYSDIEKTEFTGRSARYHHYFCSLRSLLKMKLPMEMYTSHHQHKDFLHEYTSDELKYIDLKFLDLKDTYIYEKIKPLKSSNTLQSFRCYEIMHSKSLWLRDAALKKNDDDYIYWIDAGLSHQGLFPDRLKTNRDKEDIFNKYYNYSVFNERLFNNIISQTGDKMYGMCFDQSEMIWARLLDEKYFTNRPVERIHMIGGLLGGKKQVVIDFCNKVEVTLAQVMSDGILPTEEEVYTAVACNYPEIMSKQLFNCWYSEDSDLYHGWKSGKKSQIREFYKLLEC